jgi:hypothetical protein
MGKLVLLLADGSTQDVLLTKEQMTIGRRPDNDICLPHPAVSGEHASVVTILADSFLEDLGSTNGTVVNGKPVGKHFLRDNDQIDIGRQRMVFLSDNNARVDGLQPDIARQQRLGLNSRVESARPSRSSDAAPARDATESGRRAMNLDLDREIAEAPAAASEPRRKAAPEPARIGQRPTGSRRESDKRLAAWAAEWAAPTGSTGAGAIDTSDAPANADKPGSPSTVSAAAKTTGAPEAKVRVLSGPNLGRAVAFSKDELSVGRVGVQVAVVRKVGNGFRLVPVEGAQPPSINGAPVDPEGTVLHPGDTFEVAGVRLELSITT